jgi:hypothetical protein
MFVLCLPTVPWSQIVTLGDTSTCPVECGLCTLPFKDIILRAAMVALLSYRRRCTSFIVMGYFSPRYLQATRIKDGYSSEDVHLQVPCGAFSLSSSSYM